MIKLLKNASQVITVNTNGKNFKRGSELGDISAQHEHSVVIEDDIIKDILPLSVSDNILCDEEINVEGKIVIPGLVESHTHLVFAGSRANEFGMKIKGSSYEEIANAGGGIMNTVAAVREKSIDQLYDLSSPRLENLIKQGVTTVEIKSGYGLDLSNEVKILSTIKKLGDNYPVDIIPTFLGAHTVPKEFKNNRSEYLKIITDHMIPYIAYNKLASFCDIFCESSAFSVNEVSLIFQKAKEAGFGLKLHTDQFNSLGGVNAALDFNVSSIEHLEVLPEEYFRALGNSEIVCTLLPGVSFFLDYQYAPARELIENNAIIALASDYNPGSSNIDNVYLIMSLAAVKMKLCAEEILSAYTINAAKSLGMSSHTGSIEPGKKADLAVLNIPDYNEIIYNVGKNFNYLTIKNGNIIWKKEE